MQFLVIYIFHYHSDTILDFISKMAEILTDPDRHDMDTYARISERASRANSVNSYLFVGTFFLLRIKIMKSFREEKIWQIQASIR